MKYKFLLIIALAIACLTSCSTPKDITYFQDVQNGSVVQVDLPYMLKVQPGDKLRILVSTQDERLTQMLNLQAESVSVNYNTLPLGYLVTNEGMIDFPCLGPIEVGGYSRQEIAEIIKRKLRENNLVKDPVVVVDFLNLGVSVLGNVKSPGRYDILNDRFTILEAIAKAGDLDITAKRENIKVLRNEVGQQKIYEVNLLDAESLYRSPVFFLQQNDVVYVEPNDKRKREATINGNTPLTYGFWMSMASFLMSVAVFVTK